MPKLKIGKKIKHFEYNKEGYVAYRKAKAKTKKGKK
jgi:hypothetical protein